MTISRLLFLCCLVLSASAHSKPFTLDQDIQPQRLDLTPMKNRPNSKAVGVQGVTIDNGHYFYVKGHGMTQPVDVILEAPDDRNVSLDIFLSTWSNPVLSSSTENTGLTTHQLTAYGEFGIRVTGPNTGTPYLLSVVAHPDIAPTLGNPFTAQQQQTADSVAQPESSTPSETSGSLMYIVIGLLLIIIILVALLLKKRGAAVVVIGFCSITWISAPPAEANESTDDTLRIQPGGFEDPLNESSWEGMTTDQADKVWNGGVKTIEYLTKFKEGWDAYQALDSCMSIESPPNMPLVPSFCPVANGLEDSDGGSYIMNSGQDCSQCFTDSRMAFNKARLDLEKLRVIYSCTKKMSNAAIAAGDSMSGIHGYSGVIWQGQRHEISRSVEKMEKAYDQKYPELMKNLQNAMVDMAICEAQYGTPDWYDRFGFIYFEFMRDAYKRKD